MATPTVTGPDIRDSESVQLTRWHRDATHREIRQFGLDRGVLNDFRLALEQNRVDDAREIGARIVCCMRLLNQIGWANESDRDTYTVAIDNDLAARFKYRLAETTSALAETRETFGASEADSDLEFVAACYAILNTLEATQ